jgi:hypothetical protein
MIRREERIGGTVYHRQRPVGSYAHVLIISDKIIAAKKPEVIVNALPEAGALKKDQNIPNHTVYDATIRTINRIIRILYPHLLQIPKCEELLSLV